MQMAIESLRRIICMRVQENSTYLMRVKNFMEYIKDVRDKITRIKEQGIKEQGTRNKEQGTRNCKCRFLG
ncbi:MAG: hypothetical protein K0R15_1125 [Clostridiales bacterium]|nr:hypothetical protein [Clostridiales bacterium]